MKDGNQKLEEARDNAAYLLSQLALLFKVDIKVTFIARHPKDNDIAFILTDDDLKAVQYEIERAIEKPLLSLNEKPADPHLLKLLRLIQ